MRLIYALLLIFASQSADASGVSGPAIVIDGDTLVIDGVQIELWGFDAPELKQDCTINSKSWPCGAVAAKHITTFTKGKRVSCKEKPTDSNEVTYFKCAIGSLDIGAEMVEVGLALPNWKVSARYYIRSYQEARGQGRGMHQGSFEAPWVWRTRQPTK